MKIEIGYADGVQALDVPEKNLAGILRPNRVDLAGTRTVEEALRAPIASKPLSEIVRPGESVVIITSDVTRPVPSYKILPPVIAELQSAGIPLRDITVVFALGSHRPHTEQEMKKLVGEEVFRAVRCIDGNPDDCVRLGKTKRGTPVDITRVVAEADRRIGVGNLEYHYFVGYSGGAKAIMPGASTRAAIQQNHRMMVLPEAAAGRLLDNPVRMDIEEAASFCPLDFIVNVVLDEKKEILHAVAGDMIKAHRAGCAFLDMLYLKPIPRRADIVVASQGGAPKDLNLYQTQKALDNAKHAVRDGGVVILAGSCKEGLGERVFAEWMEQSRSPEEMTARIQSDFQLGGHKAAAIALVLQKADIYLVSEMDPLYVKSIFLTPFPSVQSALDAAFRKMGQNASVLVMPWAGSTLPVVQ